MSGSTLTAFTNTRGATFATPGTNFLQTPLDDPELLAINPSYATTFSFFSPLRIFTPVGSNVTDVTFSVPGTAGATAASVGGFGAVFSDVDLEDVSTLELFGLGGASLGLFPVLPGTIADGSLSFLGIFGSAGEQITRVRIVTGNSALGPNDDGIVDVVAMDDFLYSEPQEIAIASVPEPASVLLAGLGLLAAAGLRRRTTRT